MVFDSPLRPLTRPPEDMDISYLPSSERLMVMGRRFETSRRRPSSFFFRLSLVGVSIMLAVAMSYSRCEVRCTRGGARSGLCGCYGVSAEELGGEREVSAPSRRVCGG